MQAAGLGLPTMVRGLWLFGVVRGWPRVSSRPARELARGGLTNSGRLTLEPNCLWRAGGDREVQSGSVAPRLFGLRGQSMGVEPFSFLPQSQSEAGDLVCHGEAGQVRPHALIEAVLVKRMQET